MRQKSVHAERCTEAKQRSDNAAFVNRLRDNPCSAIRLPGLCRGNCTAGRVLTENGQTKSLADRATRPGATGSFRHTAGLHGL